MKRISAFLLRLLGWKVEGSVAPEPKCIIIGVPHTSSWDFVISYLFYASLGGKASIMVKKEFFFWPADWFVRKMGGVPIDRSKGANVIRQAVHLFNTMDHLHLAMTPEGTRKRVVRWKAGFHSIAKLAGVPVYLGSFDWGRKVVTIGEKFEITEDAQADIRCMKDHYREKGIRGRFPENFTTEY